jgi:hypothetical protein
MGKNVHLDVFSHLIKIPARALSCLTDLAAGPRPVARQRRAAQSPVRADQRCALNRLHSRQPDRWSDRLATVFRSVARGMPPSEKQRRRCPVGDTLDELLLVFNGDIVDLIRRSKWRRQASVRGIAPIRASPRSC